MASIASPKVGTPDRANKTVADTQVSPLREIAAASGHQNGLVGATSNLAQTSSVNVPPISTGTDADAITTTTSVTTTESSGVMRTQRQTSRHDPLARPANKKKNGKQQGVNDTSGALGPLGPPSSPNGSSNGPIDSDDRLDGVEADLDDLVPADPNAGNWTDEFPGLLESVQRIACLQGTLRGIHDDTEDGLRFMARGMNLN